MADTTFVNGTVIVPDWLNDVNDLVYSINDVKRYGAIGDGTTDDTAAVQAAIDACIATGKPFVLWFPAGEYKITDELDFTAATEPYHVRGEGKDSTIFRPTGFGTAKKMFKGNATSNPIYIAFRDFSIRGFNDSREKTHPVIFYYPGASRISFSHISSASIGNTIIQAGPAFNADWNNLEFFTSGWQPSWKSVGSSITVSTTNGSPTVTASAALFDAGDVGQTVFVQQNDGATGNPSNSTLAAVISAYVSPTEVTLDRNAWRTESGKAFSFDSVRGSITAADQTLTFNADCLTQDDVGRIIAIQNAGSGTGAMLSTKIASVTSGTVCELEDAADSTVTDAYVWFSGPIYVGKEVTPAGSTPVNDLTLSDVHMEQFRGPALFIDQGTNVFITRFKAHGRAPSTTNGFGDSRQAIILNDTSRVSVNQYEIEFCCVGVDRGNILATGTVSAAFNDGIIGGFTHGGYLFEFETASEQSLLSIGTIQAATIDWTKTPGLVKATGTTAARRVTGPGMITSVGHTEERAMAMPPVVAGSFRSMTPVSVADDAAISLVAQREQGFVFLSTDSTTHNGIYWYRVSSSPNLQVFGTPGTNLNNTTGVLTGTTGTDVKMTISAADDGKIYVENRSGATRTVTLTFLGG